MKQYIRLSNISGIFASMGLLILARIPATSFSLIPYGNYMALSSLWIIYFTTNANNDYALIGSSNRSYLEYFTNLFKRNSVILLALYILTCLMRSYTKISFSIEIFVLFAGAAFVSIGKRLELIHLYLVYSILLLLPINPYIVGILGGVLSFVIYPVLMKGRDLT